MNRTGRNIRQVATETRFLVSVTTPMPSKSSILASRQDLAETDSTAVIKDPFITESARKSYPSASFFRPYHICRTNINTRTKKINSKKVLDGILDQCYMALTPCLECSEVGGKEASGCRVHWLLFYQQIKFVPIPSHRRMNVLGCPEPLPFAPL